MTKRNRLKIFLICIALFLIITPYIILSALGYRVDFENKKIVATGGIYVRVLSEKTDIIIDSKARDTTSIFSNSVFVQNLLPRQHSVLIQKEGYYDYQKNLLVQEKKVAKLENIILFKKNYIYNLIGKDINYFSVAPNNIILLKVMIKSQKTDFKIVNLENLKEQSLSLPIKSDVISDLEWSNDSNRGLLKINSGYFLIDLLDSQKPEISQPAYLSQSKEVNFNPQNSNQIFYIKNKNMYLSSQALPILKNVASYKIVNQNIIWLSYDGFMYGSDILGKTTNKITSKVFPVKLDSLYSIIDGFDGILLKEDDSLLLVNKDTKILETLNKSVKNVKVSPNNQRILYFNDNEVSYYGLSVIPDNEKANLLINKFDNIKDCEWLNDDYIICSLNNKIIVSEIDTRGNVNVLNLVQTITLDNGTKILMKESEIFFNQRDKKLYILTHNNLLVSERLIP